jgi:hypothetical protein
MVRGPLVNDRYFPMRLPSSLYAKLADRAAAERRSVSAMAVILLEEALAEREEPRPKRFAAHTRAAARRRQPARSRS